MLITILWMKNDIASIPVSAGNVGRITQLIPHSTWSMLTPHIADFITTKTIRYMTDAVPARYIKNLYLWDRSLIGVAYMIRY